jgi:predicted RNA-binding protein with PUA-like domain
MEAGDRQTLLLEHSGELISEGNAIKKAYLSHAKIKKMSPGDILLFYRSQDKHEVTTLGVVEQVEFDLKTVDEIVKLVRKRSVYSVEEIQSTVLKPTTVILFSWHLHLPEPLRLEELIQHGILKTAPQTIMQISHEKYLNIKAASGIDERFTVN